MAALRLPRTRPQPHATRAWLQGPDTQKNLRARHRDKPEPADLPPGLPADTRLRKVSTSGTVGLDKVICKVGVQHAFHHVLVVAEGDDPGDRIFITDLGGAVLAEHTRPEPGTTYVGNALPPGLPPRTP